MYKKKMMLLTILLMAVGFATLATTLIINGSTIISENSTDFKVLFTNAILDGVEDNSVITDDTHIVFDTKELKNIGDKSTLVYTISNRSRNYDADITMNFFPETTEYIRVTNSLESDSIEALDDIRGTLTIELIKGYAGENTLEESVSVEIEATAKERIELPTTTGFNISGNLLDSNGDPLNNGVVVIYSEEPHFFQTSESGYFYAGNLENIDHEFYYIPNKKIYEIKDLEKEQIIELASINSTFNKHSSNLTLDNASVSNLVIDKTSSINENEKWNYNYTGVEEVFTAPSTGRYLLETWGAQGGSYGSYTGGFGGYSTGVITLYKDTDLFINVGGEGKIATNESTSTPGGYNGGGGAVFGANNHPNRPFRYYFGSGGGATHIATVSGLLSKLNDNKQSVIIVSGGGGGISIDNGTISQSTNGGNAGGYQAPNVTRGGYTSIGGGQEYNGNNAGFGYGRTSYSGGGAGWYGGEQTNGTWVIASAGGSSYIGNSNLTDKTMYCYGCAESTEESTKTVKTNCKESTPTKNCAKLGNGYARITYLGV